MGDVIGTGVRSALFVGREQHLKICSCFAILVIALLGKFHLVTKTEAFFNVSLVNTKRVERGLHEVVQHFRFYALHQHFTDTFCLNFLAQTMQLRRTALIRRQFFLRCEMCRQDIFDERLLLD